MPRETWLSVQIVELNVPEPEVVNATIPVGVIFVPVAMSEIVTVHTAGEFIATEDGAHVTDVEVARLLIVMPR